MLRGGLIMALVVGCAEELPPDNFVVSELIVAAGDAADAWDEEAAVEIEEAFASSEVALGLQIADVRNPALGPPRATVGIWNATYRDGVLVDPVGFDSEGRALRNATTRFRHDAFLAEFEPDAPLQVGPFVWDSLTPIEVEGSYHEDELTGTLALEISFEQAEEIGDVAYLGIAVRELFASAFTLGLAEPSQGFTMEFSFVAERTYLD